MIKVLFIIITLVFSCIRTYSQDNRNDFLIPKEPLLICDNWEISYEYKIYSKLLKRKSDHYARVLMTQSFEPEMLLSIYRSNNSFSFGLSKCEKQIWNNENWDLLEVIKTSSKVSSDFAQAYRNLIKAAVERTRYLEKKDLPSGVIEDDVILDGTFYYFSYNQNNYLRMGYAHSPSIGSRNHKLVEITNSIITLVQNEKEFIEYPIELKEKIISLTKEYINAR